MALYVDYKRKMGELTLIQDENKFKINIYACNALCAFIYEYTNDEGQEMCKLMNFLNDKQHIKNLLKSRHELFLGKVENIRLNMYYMSNIDVLHYFTEMGVTVTCYNKKPKEEKY